MFTALASGGAVVISQYIGKRSREEAGESASQLLTFSIVFSLVLSIIVLASSKWMLHQLFGEVEPEVMQACITYLKISVYSYPALAIYNAGAALYRSVGRTSVTMNISIIANIINVVGNCIGVFILHAGVAGVAWPSLVSRVFSAIMITILCFRQEAEVHYQMKWICSWNQKMMKSILRIAIPNGAENGIFQFVKVALSSIVALFGTYQIAANGVAQSIWSMAALMGVAIGPIFITVIGQCMGYGDQEEAIYNMKHLMKICLVASVVWNALIFILTPYLLHFYSLSEETKRLVIELVAIHNLFNAFAFPFSGCLSTGLRAAGDVKFTMIVSILSTLLIRLVFSYLLGVTCSFGVIGIAIAMVMDWIVRAIVFEWRFRSKKWLQFQVI